MAGLQKCGYLEVKEPSNIKGRKLKTWKHKWVVLQEMSNLASGTLAAKLDLYQTEASAINNSRDKVTYLLENVTSVEPCHSKTHRLAFQIVATSPLLVLCADSDYTTNAWMSTLKKIFTPDLNSFNVEIMPNEDCKKFSLSGAYCMSVSPEAVTISDTKSGDAMGWRLETLKRFYMKNDKCDILVIESGAKAECGEAKFEFKTKQVTDILQSIRSNIQIAISERKQTQSNNIENRTRTLSTSSFEKGFQNILLNSKNVRTSSIGSNASGGSGETIISKTDSDANFRIIGEHRKARSSSLNLGKSNPKEEDLSYATVSKQTLKEKFKSQHFRANSLDSSPIHSLEDLDIGTKRTKSCEDKDLFEKPTQYDVLNIKQTTDTQSSPPIDIVAKLTIRSEENKEIELVVDSHGYSHVASNTDTEKPPIKEKSPYNEVNELVSEAKDNLAVLRNKPDEENRFRTVSGTSADSVRSSSVGSHDSGISSINTEKSKEVKDGISREGSSFDSDMSNTDITVSVSEAIVVTSSDGDALKISRSISHPSSSSLDSKCLTDESEIYSEVPSQNNSKHVRSKSDPVGYDSVESEYEELDKYRKDLKQFLGMEPNKSPDEVPPSLPERPSTMPSKRKTIEKRKKKVSFPLIMKPRKNHRDDSSSSVSSDEDEKVTSTPVAAISSWPIEKTRIPNSLYESSELEMDSPQNESSDKVQTMRSSDSDSKLISMQKWPLKMTARANCNMFYTSTDEVPQIAAAIKKVTSESALSDVDNKSTDINSNLSKDVNETAQDKSEKEDHIYASVEANDENKEESTQAIDLLTGDSAFVSSSTIPVIEPQKSEVKSPEFDLLTWDVPEENTKTSPLPSKKDGFPVVLDVLVPFSASDISDANALIDIDDSDTNKLRMRRKGVIENPFPNLTRYSGQIQELTSDVKSTEANNELLFQSDPFDIFHMGVISNSLGFGTSSPDSLVGNGTSANIKSPTTTEHPLGSEKSETSLLDLTDEPESLYMAMNKKVDESEYVAPSTLK